MVHHSTYFYIPNVYFLSIREYGIEIFRTITNDVKTINNIYEMFEGLCSSKTISNYFHTVF